MRGLFSFLFGASHAAGHRARRSGRRSPAPESITAAWPGCSSFGLVHFYLIWWGDILALYAPIGMIAFLFRRLRTSRLVTSGLILLLFQFLFFAMPRAPGACCGGGRGGAGREPGGHRRAGRSMRARLRSLCTGEELRQMLDLYRGGYAGQVHVRTGEMLFRAAQRPVAVRLGDARLYAARNGGAETGLPDRRLERIGTIEARCMIGFGIGIPAYAALAWWIIRDDFSVQTLIAGWIAATVPFRPLMIGATAAWSSSDPPWRQPWSTGSPPPAAPPSPIISAPRS
jgi:uncharacterized protein